MHLSVSAPQRRQHLVLTNRRRLYGGAMLISDGLRLAGKLELGALALP